MPYNHFECAAFGGANEVVVVILELFWHRNTLIFKFIQQQQQQQQWKIIIEKPFPNPNIREMFDHFPILVFDFQWIKIVPQRVDNSSDATNGGQKWQQPKWFDLCLGIIVLE